MNNRQLFLRHLAQTSDAPLALEITHAEGMYMYQANGKRLLDLIAGISVCNMGHCHPAVVAAIQQQAGTYMHLLVYGELVQSPQVAYAHLLTQHLPAHLNSVFFTNSGAEATEGAMKLAKRHTGRTEIIGFTNAYHGSTQGALSLIGDESMRNAYRPLIPGIRHIAFNEVAALQHITERTAAVMAETVMGEAGIRKPTRAWLQALRQRCTDTGTLLILDENQCGLGRTGSLWAFEQYGITPDILTLGKALGGGMPLGAFVADRLIMNDLTHAPVLGHITTFGGHPVSCAAGLAGFEALLHADVIATIPAKEQLFHTLLQHPRIQEVRSAGLMMAVQLDDFPTNKKVIDYCIERGLLTDWFLFCADALRIAPPLIITENQIREACTLLLEALDNV
ncbi:Acetylornithine/succinyldiaminopimelate/putrescine aminotransferase [Chitinophaga costaii]|uniref:Acetylornithine/succinyldiaminopimelate/putrescine aminotransferase n=1 Tax=Chitinophaga costaii TaxID=1335309 RepID=A0A1C4DWD4_9BACT|nr:aminotransferase class III-fold pyridoxal phosphate-dependent enzyme [Chitinophaga costaii]PUZ27834.1 aspartate aminotransferase family protein [Chitinophaga costaii]SCC35600.1 Acetylornithine/succinyldiaminopimelate/putrescine aminotransferase [Chitinophaga costaii]